VDNKNSIKVITTQMQLEDIYNEPGVTVSSVVLFTPHVAEVHYKTAHGFARPNLKASPILNCYTTARARIEMHKYFVSLMGRGYQLFYT